MHKSWQAVTKNRVIKSCDLRDDAGNIVREACYLAGSESDAIVSPSHRLCASSVGDREPAEGLRVE